MFSKHIKQINNSCVSLDTDPQITDGHTWYMHGSLLPLVWVCAEIKPAACFIYIVIRYIL